MDTNSQYLAYLQAEVKRKEALNAELLAASKPPTLLTQRLRVNGAGTHIWVEGKWRLA